MEDTLVQVTVPIEFLQEVACGLNTAHTRMQALHILEDAQDALPPTAHRPLPKLYHCDTGRQISEASASYVIDLARQGHPTKAIRALRALTNMGLRDACNWIKRHR